MVNIREMNSFKCKKKKEFIKLTIYGNIDPKQKLSGG